MSTPLDQSRRAQAQREYRELHEAYRATKDKAVFERALRIWSARFAEFEPDGCKSCHSHNIVRKASA